ncbi:hypothetical protein FGG08_004856 [Glutinoglossum americanum]|uniref:C2H2-type domain-containing protein n=1 Tax=Glutinoglossum americanum TaxID=1670608 RepID=A0A9P8I6M8_9PEZI|nr:hypothetical protein FGG08_004856 [Glutinoglossum americanum]
MSTGSQTQKIVKCGKCRREHSIPVKCDCGASLPSPQDDSSRSRDAKKSKFPCDRCGDTFKRIGDMNRHQQYHCTVRRDAPDDAWFYCHLNGDRSCRVRAYRPDKLSDHLRQIHGFGRVGGSQDEGVATSSFTQDPSQGGIAQLGGIYGEAVGTDVWLTGEIQSQAGMPEPYSPPYGDPSYSDNATSRFPLPGAPSALDSASRRHQYHPATTLSYNSPGIPEGLQASMDIENPSYPMITDTATHRSRRSHHHSAVTSGDIYSPPSTDTASWNDNGSSQGTRSHRRAPEPGQYSAYTEPGQHRHRRNHGDGWQGSRG